MYVLDTNIWLERLLDQEQSATVGHFLQEVPSSDLHITDFSLHSIGVILHRLENADVFLEFVHDLFIDGAVNLITVAPEQMERLVSVSVEYGLDFDDAYQYVAAEQAELPLLSFDSDFDRTQRGRVTPLEALKLLDASG